MRTRARDTFTRLALASALLSAALTPGLAQTPVYEVPVDEQGRPVGDYEAAELTGDEGIPLLSAGELADLVGPIALYPDDLLAIVLPASTYPLQLVEAHRFLDALADDPSLKPDDDWDDSVVALINYPEVVALLNEDLDWTWRLGEAVVAQQADVVSAVQGFRERAYAAGNLHSDGRQLVARNDDVIEITPVAEDVIYVPYYEPEKVVVYQPRVVYHYHPRPYPVYYYPYPSWHSFHSGFFWGVTTAYTIGWLSDRVHVHHHSYYGHPYYGRSYRDRWWYRRPSIHVHNSIYVNRYDYGRTHRYRHGDYWRPRHHRRLHSSNQRITRNRHYTDAGSRPIPRTRPRASSRSVSESRTVHRPATVHRSGDRRTTVSGHTVRRDATSHRSGSHRSGDTTRNYSTRRDTATVTRQRSVSQKSAGRGNIIRNDTTREQRSSRQRSANVESQRRVVRRAPSHPVDRRAERQSQPSQVRQAPSSRPKVRQAPSSRQRQEVAQTRAVRSGVPRTRTAEPRAAQTRASRSKTTQPRTRQSTTTQSRQSARQVARRDDSHRHHRNR